MYHQKRSAVRGDIVRGVEAVGLKVSIDHRVALEHANVSTSDLDRRGDDGIRRSVVDASAVRRPQWLLAARIGDQGAPSRAGKWPDVHLRSAGLVGYVDEPLRIGRWSSR